MSLCAPLHLQKRNGASKRRKELGQLRKSSKRLTPPAPTTAAAAAAGLSPSDRAPSSQIGAAAPPMQRGHGTLKEWLLAKHLEHFEGPLAELAVETVRMPSCGPVRRVM